MSLWFTFDRSMLLGFSKVGLPQLIEGVGFLHRHGIAHLDIKPQNIVALPHQIVHNRLWYLCPCLWPKCVDRQLVRDSWIDGPRCSYSPIRADCGLVVECSGIWQGKAPLKKRTRSRH